MNTPTQNILHKNEINEYFECSFDLQNVRTAESTKPVTIAVGSGKGGVGKTFFAASLGYYFTHKNKTVTIIDTDFSSPSLHTYFNILHPKRTLRDLIIHPKLDLNHLVYNTSIKNLNVIFGSPSTLGMNENSYAIASKIIKTIRSLDTDIIIFDLGASSASDLRLFLEADEGIIITNPEPPAIQESFNFLKFCLFKKLEQLLQGKDHLLKIIDSAYDNFNSNSSEQIKSIIQELHRSNNPKVVHAINKFRPGVVLNKVKADQESAYSLAVQISIKEIFGISIKNWGHIGHNPKLRAIHVDNDYYEHVIEKDGYSNIYYNIIQQILSKDLQNNLNSSRIDLGKMKGVKSRQEIQNSKDLLICSSKCSLWNRCSHQRGGYPCKMKYIGFLCNH